MGATKNQYQVIRNYINLCFFNKTIQINIPFDPKKIYEGLKNEWPNDQPTYLNFCKAAEEIFDQKFKTLIKTHSNQKFAWIVCDNVENTNKISREDKITNSIDKLSSAIESIAKKMSERNEFLKALEEKILPLVMNHTK